MEAKILISAPGLTNFSSVRSDKHKAGEYRESLWTHRGKVQGPGRPWTAGRNQYIVHRYRYEVCLDWWRVKRSQLEGKHILTYSLLPLDFFDPPSRFQCWTESWSWLTEFLISCRLFSNSAEQIVIYGTDTGWHWRKSFREQIELLPAASLLFHSSSLVAQEAAGASIVIHGTSNAIKIRARSFPE